MRSRVCGVVLLAVLGLAGALSAPALAGDGGPWVRPVAGGVVRGFDPPATRYGAGHRGVDLTAPIGTPVSAPDDGTVLFAGRVVDRGVLSIDHGTVRSSFEPVRPLVHAGEHVSRGQVVALVAAPGATHPPGVLHLGARVQDGYVSPLLFLGALRRAVLLPLAPPP